MKDFPYKKMGDVRFALHFGNSGSVQGGVSGKGIFRKGAGTMKFIISFWAGRGTIEFKKGVG